METIKKSDIEKLQEVTRIDYDKIAENFYNMIPESEKDCMIAGMLPAKFMELLENGLRDKFERLVSKYRAFYIETFEGMPEYLESTTKECDDYVKNNTRKAVHEISVRLIKIATQKGLCKV